jgi:membrane AbrB-like protein
VVSLPFIIQYILGIDIRGNQTITTSVVNVDLLELIFLFVVGIFAAVFAKKIKLSAAFLIGPMIISIILHLTAVVTTPMPDELLKFVQVVFGTLIGFTFKGIKLSEVMKTLLGTFGHFLILIFISFIFIVIVSSLFDFDLLSILLAFSPGGQADINLIAILVGATVPYITLHHIVRLFIVVNIAYFFAKKI